MTLLRTYAIVAMLSASAVNADDFVGQADANSDGYVSLYELRAAYYADEEFNRRIEQSFAEHDTDGDGLISAAERRAQLAETAVAPAVAETAAAAAAVAETAPTPAAVAAETVPTPAAETTVAPAVAETAPAAVAETTVAPAVAATAPAATTVAPAVAGTAAAATTVAPAVAATAPAAATTVAPAAAAAPRVSDDSLSDATRMDESGDRSREASTAASVGAGSLPNAGGLSRAELRILEIDSDNSGGASVAELVASGDGRQWFSDSAFERADEDSDGDLDPEELEALLQSLERRRR